MSANRTVNVTFDAIPKFTLKVKKTGTGTGKVTSSPTGIDCGSDCEEAYEEGKEVTLTASADAGSTFVKWTGDCTGSGACKVTMSAAKEVTAEFNLAAKPKFTLKVKKTGTGTGKVTSSPTGIDCGSDCEEAYEEGKEVTLTASADAGSTFVKWTGDCTGSGTCKVTMSAAREVTAEFKTAAKSEFTLKVKKTGSGKVTSSPAGIDCPSNCVEVYEEGKEITLTATPDAGFEFVKWTGDCTGSGACKVTMSADREVIAEFNLAAKPKFTLKVKKTGTGTGKVTSAPAGIDCGSDCEEPYEEGKHVTLTATPDAGSEFVKWTGACTGTGICKVTMSAAREATAEFKVVVKPNFTLAVERIGTGTGKVTSSPAGIDCGSDCEEAYQEGKEITLTATADAGSAFEHWTGGGCSGTEPCKVTMSGVKKVRAVFNAVGQRTLTVVKAGTGTGTVTSTPKGIDCGATCTASYDVGKKITLVAVAATNSTFTGFSGACTGETCKVTMSEARSVTATFAADPGPDPSVGLVVVAGTAKVKNGKAHLRIFCNGPSACEGELKLLLKIAPRRGVVIGKATFKLQPGGSTTLKIPLSRRALAALAGRKAVQARVVGTGIHSHVVRLRNVS